jgi:hypothetical protein
MISYLLITITGGTDEVANRTKIEEGVFVCLEKTNEN